MEGKKERERKRGMKGVKANRGGEWEEREGESGKKERGRMGRMNRRTRARRTRAGRHRREGEETRMCEKSKSKSVSSRHCVLISLENGTKGKVRMQYDTHTESSRATCG